MTSLDLPGTKPPTPAQQHPSSSAAGGRGLHVTMGTAARAFLGGGLRSPRPRAGGAKGESCRPDLRLPGLPAPPGPKYLSSGFCLVPPVSAPSFRGSLPHPGLSRPRGRARVWGWMGTRPNSLKGGAGGRRGHVGRRAKQGIQAAGSGGQRCSSRLYKDGPPRPPSSLPLSPPPSGVGREWGGTLAAGRVERAVRSPVTSLAVVKTSGGPKPGRREGSAEVGPPNPSNPCFAGTLVQIPLTHLLLHDPEQVISLGFLSLSFLIQQNVCDNRNYLLGPGQATESMPKARFFPSLPPRIISVPLFARFHYGKLHGHPTPTVSVSLPADLKGPGTSPTGVHPNTASPGRQHTSCGNHLERGLAFPQGLWIFGETLELGSLHVYCLSVFPAPRMGTEWVLATFLLSNA